MSQNERNERPLRSQSRPTHRFSRSSPRPRLASTRPEPSDQRSDTRRQTFESFAQSVSCLLGDSEPTPTDRQALVSLVRQSFPEYTRAKQSLTSARERQQTQVERLGPDLLTNASLLSASTPGDAEGTPNDIIDESARIIWELGRIDEQIEVLQQRINLLQHQIMTWIQWEEPSNTRAVRWALENA